MPLTVHTQKGAYRNFENSKLKNKIEICINMGPYGSGNFKNATPSLQFWFFLPYFFWMFPVTIHTKLASWKFEISFFSVKNWNLTFNVANQKIKNFPISWKWPSVEQNRVKFRTRISKYTCVCATSGTSTMTSQVSCPKYATFKNWPVSRKPLQVEWRYGY